MKQRFLGMFLVMILASCDEHGHDEHGHDEHGHDEHGHDEHGHDEHGHDEQDGETDERPALSFTNWTDASELFIELPALVRGQESACAAHLTTLDGFVALAEGQVTVVLRNAAGDERFESSAPTVPGIFRPVARPSSSGMHRMIVEVRSPGLSADHDLGEVMVYESDSAARDGIREEAEVPGRIPFLKEQQWPIEFATELVAERALRPSLQTTGRIAARSDGEVMVTAPVAGRVASTSRSLPRLGERVTVNELLGVLAPRLDAADLGSLELAVTSANLEVRFAVREQQRLEALQREGAIPERRVQDARHAAESAQASLAAAESRIGQFRHVQQPRAAGRGAVQLRSPLSGTITEVLVSPGTFVEAGAPLFRVTDLTQLWLVAQVPEIDVPRLGELHGASFEIAGVALPFELASEALVARGGRIDPRTLTLPVVFGVDNAASRLTLGSFARVFLAIGSDRRALAVPDSALVDDNGIWVVFVHAEGESFERRIVRLGIRDRGYVEVLSGLTAGEHIVTRGAWSVKLAASSGSIPAHGHAH